MRASQLSFACAFAVVLVLAACGDAGTPGLDAGTPDGSHDAGDTSTDAGSNDDAGHASDGGSTDASHDGGAADGGETDGGETDGGATDGGGVVGDELIRNGGFESWTGPKPDAWLGVQGNVAIENVVESRASPHGGLRAARLMNESDSHKRFTTEPLSVRAGRYSCTYWVRGHGEIRTGRYTTDFSSYTPSGYHAIDSDEWEEKSFAFSLATDVHDTFELVFSFRNTNADRGHLVLDDVSCVRAPEPCDEVTCESWAKCDNATVSCEPLSGRCAADADCADWQRCDATHACVPAEGRCREIADCAATPATPVCNRTTHSCEAGDPCAGVTCREWESCAPATGRCALAPDRCYTSAHCTGTLPACDIATHSCVAVSHPANIFPNGGFEAWSTYRVPYRGEHLLPDAWYGLDVPGSSEIDPADVRRYDTAPHSGSYAVQLLMSGIPDRFTSEAFDIPAGSYTCSYRVRGHGSIRHRYYSSAGWGVYTDRVQVDSDQWAMISFDVAGNVRDFRLIFYAGDTQADREHVQIDDVVCTKR